MHVNMVAEHGCAQVMGVKPVHMRAVGSRRAAWRIRAEQTERIRDDEQQAVYARVYLVKVDDDLTEIYDSILAPMDENLIPSASAGGLEVFYYKTKSNFYQNLAEFARGDAKCKAVEDARVTYAEATKIDEKDSVGTHPIYLDLAPNLTVLQYEVLRNPDDACKMARVASEKVQKTVEVPQVQYIDKIADAPVVMQGQVPTIQTVQKIVEVLQVQFIDRVLDVPVVTQRREIPSKPQGKIHERIVEEIIEVSVSRVMEKIILVVKHIPQERVQNGTEEQIVDVPVPQCRKETGEVIQLFPQDRISDRIVDQIVGHAPVQQIREQIGEVMKLIPQKSVQSNTVEYIVDEPVPQITQETGKGTPFHINRQRPNIAGGVHVGKNDLDTSHITGESIAVRQEISVLTETIEEKTVRQGNLSDEVEKLKSQHSEAESTLPAGKEPVCGEMDRHKLHGGRLSY